MPRSRSLARFALAAAAAIALLLGDGGARSASARSLGRGDDGGDGDLRLGSLGRSGAALAADELTEWEGHHLAQNVLDTPANGVPLGVANPSSPIFGGEPRPEAPSQAGFPTPPLVFPGGGATTGVFPGGGATNGVFPTTADALSAVGGSAPDVASGLDELKVFHSLTSFFPGEVVVTPFGVRNHSPSPIPEPGTGLLLGLGLLALAARRRRD